tara:strand:- start:537 stop:716 length:180 start_codon:yes stop_codon:yes gene_type:complete
MLKEELVFCISRAMFKDHSEYFHAKAYKSVKSYFSGLKMSDLIGIARQYGVNVDGLEAL